MKSGEEIVSRVVFHPRKEDYGYSPAGRPTETPSGGESICGYFHENRNSETLLLYFHGNGELASDYDRLAGLYMGLGVSLWVVDYRGYGRSSGMPSFSGMLPDAEAVMDDVPRQARSVGAHFSRTIVMGRSLGSASAVHLAQARADALSGLVLDSPYASGPTLVQRLGGSSTDAAELVGGNDNIDKITGCSVPTLIIHGTHDNIIPIQEAEALFRACGCPDKRFVRIRGAGHNDLMLAGFEEYFSELKNFFLKMNVKS